MEMKGSYKVCVQSVHDLCLVCDMEMKGSYKTDSNRTLADTLYVTWK